MSMLQNAAKLTRSLDLSAPFRAKTAVTRPDPKVVFVGAGVIGGSVGAWVAEHTDSVYFLDQPPVAERIRAEGITTYWQDEPERKVTVRVKVIDDLDEVPDVEVIVIGVKNYSLDAVAKEICAKVGDRPIIVGMQNGLENQTILPRYFSKVIYCIVSYNAWRDEQGALGYQKAGPLYFGTRHNELQTEMEDLAAVFNRGVETHITHRLGDAAHCKLVINLTNSLTTLIGLSFREISDRALFQKLLTNLTWEGVTIIRAAGYRESRLGGMPPWRLIWAGAHLPRAITGGMFERNLKKMVVSSMAQDVIQRGSGDTELESINGYILDLARIHGVRAPYNEAIYDLAKRTFARRPYESLDVKDVWEFVRARL